MFGNAKMWPYYMYNINSWIFSYKVIKDFFITWMKFVRVCFNIIRQIGQSNNRIQFYHNVICEIITPLQPCKLLIPTLTNF